MILRKRASYERYAAGASLHRNSGRCRVLLAGHTSLAADGFGHQDRQRTLLSGRNRRGRGGRAGHARCIRPKRASTSSMVDARFTPAARRSTPGRERSWPSPGTRRTRSSPSPGSRLLNWYLPAGFELLLLGLALPAERNEAPPPPPPGGPKLPPRRLVQKLSDDYGQIPIMGLPFADPPDPAKMKTEPLAGAAALPFSSHFDTAPAYWTPALSGPCWRTELNRRQLFAVRGALPGGAYCAAARTHLRRRGILRAGW